MSMSNRKTVDFLPRVSFHACSGLKTEKTSNNKVILKNKTEVEKMAIYEATSCIRCVQ